MCFLLQTGKEWATKRI